ncbi:hypothetical protein Pla175_10370 [Pirellulimonas nuda]|uniref:Uncharacterized protein n=1 Tax=Pirellulimonas nuda TaxID=2528009 RepID=A0A518D859_9BACT|nr:hypothetical protein Pla175_10370 [Pirellulimonas nuda]
MPSDWSRKLANVFDAGPAHPLFREIEYDASYNLGGEGVAVPFYLGRLTSRNLFRCEWREVLECLEVFLARETSADGAKIARIEGGARTTLGLLQDEYSRSFGGHNGTPRKQVDAMRYLLKHPNASVTDIAEAAGTTPKQILRQTDTTYSFRLLREAGSRTVSKDCDYH